MWGYLANIIFWVIFVFMLYAFGNAMRPCNEGQSVKFIAGYMGYSFFVAIGGIVVQLLNLKWIFFAGYMTVLIGAIGIVIVLTKRKRGKLFSCSLKEYIIENWFVFLLTGILCFMLLFYFRSFWYGNHLDDGYYITKVAVIAHDGGNYKNNISVGMGKWTGITYLINTWELEASFFVTILKVSPTFFLRFFQSGFHYFVFLNCALAFGEKIVIATEKRINRATLQYVLGTFLIFFVYYVYMQDTQIFFLRDMFQLNTAMFYGSSIAKLIVIMCLLIFWIQEDVINLKIMMGVACISIIMISKTTIVLPILFIVITSSSITWLIQNKEKRWVGILITILYIIVGIIISGNDGIQSEVYKYVKLILKSPVMWVCIVVFILSFTLKVKIVYRINSIMMLSGLMIVIPQINDVFELCAVYEFVGGRAWSIWVYTFVIINAYYLYVLLKKICRDRNIIILYSFITIGMTMLLVYGFAVDGAELFVTDQMPAKTNLSKDIKVLLNNRKFMPNATIELGQELEETTKRTSETLYVLSPEFVGVDQAVHTLCTQLRIVAPDVVSVSAIERYPVDETSELYGYDQSKFDKFVANPDEQTSLQLEKEIIKYNINCIVTQNEACGKYLEKIGFMEANPVGNGTYYVWYKLRINQ